MYGARWLTFSWCTFGCPFIVNGANVRFYKRGWGQNKDYVQTSCSDSFTSTTNREASGSASLESIGEYKEILARLHPVYMYTCMRIMKAYIRFSINTHTLVGEPRSDRYTRLLWKWLAVRFRQVAPRSTQLWKWVPGSSRWCGKSSDFSNTDHFHVLVCRLVTENLGTNVTKCIPRISSSRVRP